MKKVLLTKTTIALMIFGLLTTAIPRPSNAYVGIAMMATGDPSTGAPIAGFTIAAAGLVCFANPTIQLIKLVASPGARDAEGDVLDYVWKGVALVLGLGGVGALVGFLLDDSGHDASLQFTTIEDAQGLALGATHAEIDSYNQELDLINALNENLNVELAQASAQDLDLAKERWNTSLNSVNPLTKAMIIKMIRHQFVSN